MCYDASSQPILCPAMDAPTLLLATLAGTLGGLMPTIHLEASVSPDDLLRAVEQLASAELERFASRVLALAAHRRAPSLSHDETELLQAINQGVPPEVRERYAALIARRRDETLTPEEHAELLRLGDEVEVLDARRAEHLAKLARLRGVSLDEVMNSLGIRPPGGARA